MVSSEKFEPFVLDQGGYIETHAQSSCYEYNINMDKDLTIFQ